jgi:outer membrane protein OmpA-like peptidoglycan-associated protein
MVILPLNDVAYYIFIFTTTSSPTESETARMPGQVTHFYLATRVALLFPKDHPNETIRDIRAGADAWISANNDLRLEVLKFGDVTVFNQGKMHTILEGYIDTLLENGATSDQIAVYSAFATGAVGPDLWTVPAGFFDAATGDGINGCWYFDMGHYNLSHIFPTYTLEQIRDESALSTLQLKYRTAYILGYLSHVALDILSHTMVNVFAGAYHKQTQKQWKLEASPLGWKPQPFNNHNKIEHYWDALVRYLCFEGYHKELEQQIAQLGNKSLLDFRETVLGQPHGWNFPCYTRDIFKSFWNPETMLDKTGSAIDMSTSLPGPFSHRYKQKKVEHFIHKYYWESYENVDEYIKTTSPQSLSHVSNEEEKVNFFDFDSGMNVINPDQYRYLYYAIPELPMVLNFGPQLFDIQGFGSFLMGTIPLAQSFINSAVAFLDSGDKAELAHLKNWNLDVGMAMRIRDISETFDKMGRKMTVPVCIDLVSVFEHPALQGWSVPQLSVNAFKNGKAEDVPDEILQFNGMHVEDTGTPSLPAGMPPNPSTKTIQVYRTESFGIQIRMKQICFFENDSLGEIGAEITGSSSRSNETWVMQEVSSDGEKNHSCMPAYNNKKCVDDFLNVNAVLSRTKTIELAGRAGVQYSSVFVSDVAFAKADTGETMFTAQAVRRAPRHICCSTKRTWVSRSKKEGLLEPDKLFLYKYAFPSEDVALSLFALVKNGGNYRDLYYSVDFTPAQVEELKRIKVIGVNCVVLLFDISETGALTLNAAFIDGEQQEVEKEQPATPPSQPQPQPQPGSDPTPPIQVLGLQFEDTVMFRTDSAVNLPNGCGAQEDKGDTAGELLGLNGIAAIFKETEQNGQHRMIITAHTDTKASAKYNFDLSADRGTAIVALLEGERDDWAAIAARRNHEKDIQTILTWADARYTWGCDPGPIDGDYGKKTYAALRTFKERFDALADISYKIGNSDETIDATTWGAVFELYRKELAGILGVSYAGMEDKYKQIKSRWAEDEMKSTACSEAFPIEKPTLNDYASQTNRRVEVIFYEQEFIKDKHPLCKAVRQAPDLESAKNRCFTCRKECAIFTRLPKPTYKKFNGQGGGGTTPVTPTPTPVADPGDRQIIFGQKVSPEFKAKVIAVGDELGVDPDYLMASMAFETGETFSPSIKNAAGSGATGLIQFMPSTAKRLGTTTDELAQMSDVEQLDYVKAYFQNFGRLSNVGDVYMAIFWPKGIGKSDDYVLFSEGSIEYTQNAGLDIDGNGEISRGDAVRMVKGKLNKGKKLLA